MNRRDFVRALSAAVAAAQGQQLPAEPPPEPEPQPKATPAKRRQTGFRFQWVWFPAVSILVMQESEGNVRVVANGVEDADGHLRKAFLERRWGTLEFFDSVVGIDAHRRLSIFSCDAIVAGHRPGITVEFEFPALGSSIQRSPIPPSAETI